MVPTGLGRVGRVTRPSLDELRSVCQPRDTMERRNGEHWLSLLYARRVSLRITRLLATTSVSASTVTLIMIAIGLGSSVTLIWPSWLAPVVSALLIQLYLILDCTDGELARWHKTTSARGVYLDRLGHYLVEASLLSLWGFRIGGLASAWTTLGFYTALIAILTKAETDLVAVSVGVSSADRTSETIATPRNQWVKLARSISHPLRIHRITGAVEASLLMAIVAVIGHLIDYDLEKVLLTVFAAVATLLFLGHGLAIWNSRRLDRIDD
ncbi:MAG: transferase [Ilumatobacter coccineus]|uniref:Transferase n=1 Tax=Ilumatobacter coccineus TaxID=467094 RepID=A0A2G6K8Q7_9ACTN|nr:MAG: transferase [Ilumatobacter coccineus]